MHLARIRVKPREQATGLYEDCYVAMNEWNSTARLDMLAVRNYMFAKARQVVFSKQPLNSEI